MREEKNVKTTKPINWQITISNENHRLLFYYFFFYNFLCSCVHDPLSHSISLTFHKNHL